MKRSISNVSAVFRSTSTFLLVVPLLVLLGACAGAPPAPEELDMQISTTADVNPDLQGRPSPIILHILELSSTEQFNRLDYMNLTQPSGAALGADLLSKNQMVLQPGDSKSMPMELNPQTTAIGLVAGYRDIDNAVWRTDIAITQGSTKGITVTLEQQQIVTSVSD
jgi:type VI secretion system protein VasD